MNTSIKMKSVRKVNGKKVKTNIRISCEDYWTAINEFELQRSASEVMTNTNVLQVRKK